MRRIVGAGKRDLKDASARAAFAQISNCRDDLMALGRLLLDTVLTVKTAAVKEWFDESVAMFSGNLPSRVVNNLSGCMAGLRLLEAACNRLGLAWSQVFSISLDGCAKYMEYAAREYLLDGGNSNKSIVETTLEVIDRMGLTADECRMLEDGNVAIWFKGIYDRYTQYRRDHAILGECLPYGQFMKQLRKSDLFIEGKVIQIGEDVKRGTILNYPLLRQRCDVDGFLHTHVEPLR